MVTLMTLADWAKARGLNPESVRNHWTPRAGFPAPKRRPPHAGAVGAPCEEYDPVELDQWRARWEAEHQPARYPMPPDPQEFRTLGAIAKLLGVDGRTITQYRAVLDERTASEVRGQRRYYRTADVIDVLNTRRGAGRALEPGKDHRRRTTT